MHKEFKISNWNIIQAILFFFISINSYVLTVLANTLKLWSMGDLGVYMFGGQTILINHNLYLVGRPFRLPFTYPPIAALIFSTLTAIPFDTLKILSASLNILTLLISIWICWGLSGYRSKIQRFVLTLVIAAITLWTEPIQQTLLYGQINIILMALILFDLSQSDNKIWKGIGVGIATGIKLTPAIFILYLLLTKRFNAFIVSLGTFIVTIIVGYIFLPIESHQYWQGLFLDSNRVGGVAYVSNQSLHGTFTRLFHGSIEGQILWIISAIVIGTLGLYLSVRAHRDKDELLGIITCALTGLLISPISWSHHWVWIVPIIVYLIHLNIKKQSFIGWVSITGLIALFGSWFIRMDQYYYPAGIIWFVPSLQNREYYWHGFQHVEGEIYVITGIVLLILLLCKTVISRSQNAKIKKTVKV